GRTEIPPLEVAAKVALLVVVRGADLDGKGTEGAKGAELAGNVQPRGILGVSDVVIVGAVDAVDGVLCAVENVDRPTRAVDRGDLHRLRRFRRDALTADHDIRDVDVGVAKE